MNFMSNTHEMSDETKLLSLVTQYHSEIVKIQAVTWDLDFIRGILENTSKRDYLKSMKSA